MIHRQILVVTGKNRRKGGGRERSEKDEGARRCVHLIPSNLWIINRCDRK
ncbi:hypothetical protein [Aneurinibacillus migulanus]|nr:hypothetical protein [Aneurinibacillus migulanus]